MIYIFLPHSLNLLHVYSVWEKAPSNIAILQYCTKVFLFTDARVVGDPAPTQFLTDQFLTRRGTDYAHHINTSSIRFLDSLASLYRILH